MTKKLIETDIPLQAINRESAREKSLRHGHPSTLHLWWARRPLAAARAVLWASLVDDPGNDADRRRLGDILAELVKWENSSNPAQNSPTISPNCLTPSREAAAFLSKASGSDSPFTLTTSTPLPS